MALYRSTRDIKNNKLFKGVNENILTSFFDPKELKEAREGEILYRVGDLSKSLYLIIKGEVKVKFHSQNYVTSKIHDEFFGEKEVVEETKRISSAMAFSKLIYYKIDKTTLSKVIAKYSSIAENLNKFGEYILPESTPEIERNFNITDREKPVSFRVSSNGSKMGKEDKSEKAPPPVLTQQILPDFESIENSLVEDEIIDSNENFELEQALEKLQEISVEEPEESSEQMLEEENKEEEFAELPMPENTEPIPEPEPIETLPENSRNEMKVKHETFETGINREIVRRILLALNRIYNGINLNELVKNSKRAIRDLTNSESADLVFVEEKLSKMFKVITQDGKTRNEYFEISEGLTGYCASQKKSINYDRPTEDSHFNAQIDQPGSSRMKRILYFPIISDAGETVAVLQTARDNKKFTEDEIWYLTMISKQMETAITKTKFLEQMLSTEKLNSGKKLREIITKEIHIPIEIIESYVKILHSKNLPPETDDLIRMIEKQAVSVIDLTDSILKVLVDEITLENNKVHFNEFIDDILELLSEYCESKEVKLYKKIGDGALVEIDRSKLYTAILQFIKASVADCRKDDRIYFSTELNGDSISTIIQNEGKGTIVFPEGELLDYFYSEAKLKEDDVHLLLAKKIISAHSGQVDVESVKGVSSTIKIILPIAR